VELAGGVAFASKISMARSGYRNPVWTSRKPSTDASSRVAVGGSKVLEVKTVLIVDQFAAERTWRWHWGISCLSVASGIAHPNLGYWTSLACIVLSTHL